MQVVILAGGLGTRLSEETVIKPKPMVEIGGKPILWHIMKTYSYYGFNEFIICLGYKGYFVKERFANYFLHNNDVTIDIKTNQITVHNNHKDDRKVTLIDTGDATMTGGRIKRVKDYIKGDEFMMTYGDGLSDVNIKDVYDFHNNHGKLATLVSIEPENRFGKLVIEGDKVIEFGEKKDNIGQNINGGFMVLDKKVLDYIDGDSMPFEKDPLENLAKNGELMAYKHDGFWFAMDTIKHKQDLEQLRNSGKAPWKIRS